MAELTTISIQEPQKKDLANLLKGIAILTRYDCTASKSINRDSFSIEVSVDSQDLDANDLQELKEELGWKEVDRGYFTEWQYNE